jgi:hypothetical protein
MIKYFREMELGKVQTTGAKEMELAAHLQVTLVSFARKAANLLVQGLVSTMLQLISSFLSKQNIALYVTNGQLKTGKTGTQSYAEHSRVSITCTILMELIT